MSDIGHLLNASLFPRFSLCRVQPSVIDDFLETCHVWGHPAKAVEFLSIVRLLMHHTCDNGRYRSAPAPLPSLLKGVKREKGKGALTLWCRSVLLHMHQPERSLRGGDVRRVLQMAEEDGIDVDAFLMAKACPGPQGPLGGRKSG